MAKKRKKRTKKEFHFPQEMLTVLVVIAVILFCFRGVGVNKIIGTNGSAYYSIAFGIFAVLFSFSSGLKYAVKSMVMTRLERGNASAAKKVVHAALIIGFLVSILLSAAGILLSDWLTGQVAEAIYASLPLKILILTLLPLTVSAVLNGGMEGFGNDNIALVSIMILCCITVVFGPAVIGPFYEYGSKVGNLLQNDQYAPAYGAMGAAFSVTLSSVITMLYSIFSWIMYGHEVKSRVMLESGEKEAMGQLRKGIIILSAQIFLPVFAAALAFCGQFILYFKSISALEGVVNVKDYGIYTGNAAVFMTLPVLCILLFAVYMLPEMKIGFVKRNLKRSRDKCMLALRCSALLTVPFAVFLAVLADQFAVLAGSTDVKLAAQMIRINGLTVVILGIAFVLGVVLFSAGMMKNLLIDILIALVGYFIGLSVMLNSLNMGILGAVCSNILLAVLLCFTFLFSISRHLRLRINWIRVFLAPLIGSAILAVITAIVGLVALKDASSVIIVLICSIVGSLFYFIAVIALRGVSQRELNAYPCGEILIMVARKLRLL